MSRFEKQPLRVEPPTYIAISFRAGLRWLATGLLAGTVTGMGLMEWIVQGRCHL